MPVVETDSIFNLIEEVINPSPAKKPVLDMTYLGTQVDSPANDTIGPSTSCKDVMQTLSSSCNVLQNTTFESQLNKDGTCQQKSDHHVGLSFEQVIEQDKMRSSLHYLAGGLRSTSMTEDDKCQFLLNNAENILDLNSSLTAIQSMTNLNCKLAGSSKYTDSDIFTIEKIHQTLKFSDAKKSIFSIKKDFETVSIDGQRLINVKINSKLSRPFFCYFCNKYIHFLSESEMVGHLNYHKSLKHDKIANVYASLNHFMPVNFKSARHFVTDFNQKREVGGIIFPCCKKYNYTYIMNSEDHAENIRHYKSGHNIIVETSPILYFCKYCFLPYKIDGLSCHLNACKFAGKETVRDTIWLPECQFCKESESSDSIKVTYVKNHYINHMLEHFDNTSGYPAYDMFYSLPEKTITQSRNVKTHVFTCIMCKKEVKNSLSSHYASNHGVAYTKQFPHKTIFLFRENANAQKLYAQIFEKKTDLLLCSFTKPKDFWAAILNHKNEAFFLQNDTILNNQETVKKAKFDNEQDQIMHNIGANPL